MKAVRIVVSRAESLPTGKNCKPVTSSVEEEIRSYLTSAAYTHSVLNAISSSLGITRPIRSDCWTRLVEKRLINFLP